MPDLDLKAEIAFIMTKPSSPGKIGIEAQRMVNWAKGLGMYSNAWTTVEKIVRRGFAYNFESEGVPSGPWDQLKERTQNERDALADTGVALVPGFSATHPILQRTGEYRKSWVDADDSKALADFEQPEEGSLFMFLGSAHPYVPRLSGGRDAPMESALAASGMTNIQGMLEDMGMEQVHPWSDIAPRPVNEMFPSFEDELERLATTFGESFANRASG